jgi:GNAT superfamily N-acetyltransferase
MAENPIVVREAGVIIQQATAADLDDVKGFYALAGYAGSVAPGDRVLFARDGVQMVGVLRLSRESGVTVLRGMRVASSHQRQGVGARLLDEVARTLVGEPCYCIPYAHLDGFYGRIGFQPIDPASAPAFLAERLADYTRRRPEDFCLMLRPG